jgi:hypothetical protein
VEAEHSREIFVFFLKEVQTGASGWCSSEWESCVHPSGCPQVRITVL